MLQEKVAKSWSGWVMVGVLLAVLAGSIVMLASSSDVQETAGLIAAVVAVLALDGLGWFGFTVVTPNTARVVLLFGKYLGSIKTPGFWWVNPLTTRRMVSLKVRNFESGKL
jgi:regulator of protease activity HflC (stomatin/prohibitin superfamily)